MASKVASKRGDRAPELAKNRRVVEKLHSEMYAHIQKEEQVLFPFISQMDQESIVAYPPRTHASGRLPIRFHDEQEHESAGHIVAQLTQLTKSL